MSRLGFAAAFVVLSILPNLASANTPAPDAPTPQTTPAAPDVAGTTVVETAAPESAPESAPAAGLVAGIDWASWLPSTELFAIGTRIVLAVLLFLAGWVFAKLFSYAVYRMLCRTDLDDRLAAKLGADVFLKDRPKDAHTLERYIASVVHYTLMALVVVGVLQYGGLTQVAAPIQRLVDTVMQALPLVGKAVLILGVAYLAGFILQTIVTAALTRLGVDRRFAELAGDAAQDPAKSTKPAATPAFSQTAGQAIFWLLMLVGLAGAFDALQIEAIAAPLRNALDRLVSFLPAAGTAALIAVGGYALARIARAVVKNGLHALGFDSLAARVGVDKLTGRMQPSDVAGMVLMAFIVLQAGIAALDELGLQTLSVPLTAMVAQFWAALPAIAVSVFIVGLGVVVGRLARTAIAAGLKNLGFNRLLTGLGFGTLSERKDGPGDYSDLAGRIGQVAIVLVASGQALMNLQLTTWAGYVDALLLYSVKHVLVALVIVAVGFAIANHVRHIVQAQAQRRAGEPDVPPWVGEFARYAVLVFAFTMAARQLEIAEDFVLVSFALLFGSLCLAAALAFGLGSREVAGDFVRSQYDRFSTQLAARTSAKAADGGKPTSRD